MGRHLRVTRANEKEIDTKTTIFVGNLPFTTDEEEIRNYFKECGTIDYIRLVRDRHTHKGKGIAYVKFKEQIGYLNGLKKNKQMFRDRELRVNKALIMNEDKKPVSKREAKPRWDDERKLLAKEMKKPNTEEENQN